MRPKRKSDEGTVGDADGKKCGSSTPMGVTTYALLNPRFSGCRRGGSCEHTSYHSLTGAVSVERGFAVQ